MKRISLAVLSFAALVAAGTALAEDHLVPLRDAEARLTEAAADRQRDLDRVGAVLARPEAQGVAASLGADTGKLRAALPGLSDAELADLAARAAALDTDPVAGLDQDIRLLLIIFLIVAIVILVLQAVD